MSLQNLRLTDTPVEPFRNWVRELGVPDLDLDETARNIPLAMLSACSTSRARSRSSPTCCSSTR